MGKVGLFNGVLATFTFPGAAQFPFMNPCKLINIHGHEFKDNQSTCTSFGSRAGRTHLWTLIHSLLRKLSVALSISNQSPTLALKKGIHPHNWTKVIVTRFTSLFLLSHIFSHARNQIRIKGRYHDYLDFMNRQEIGIMEM